MYICSKNVQRDYKKSMSYLVSLATTGTVGQMYNIFQDNIANVIFKILVNRDS